MLILRARAIESEAEIPFAGLGELLRPALAALDRMPGPRATALGGALAPGPVSAQDRFAIGAATLNLPAASAEEPPDLLVDGAHQLDGSSAQALPAPDRDIDRRAWHLAAASVGPDERPTRSSTPALGPVADR